MHKGFIQAGNLIFTVLFIVLALAAGYLYLAGNNSKVIPVAHKTNGDQSAQIKFVHPVYQYSLNLPYDWKGKYQVVEEGDQTNFWYTDDAGGRDLLFRVKRQPAGELIALAGDSKKLGQDDDWLYSLVIPTSVSGALSSANSQMRQEAPAIGATFSLLDKNQYETEIIQVLADNLSVSTSSAIKFSAFEIIATQESASTTEYYIWFSRQQFFWDNFRLKAQSVESKPAVIIMAKNNNNLVSIKLPRDGKNFKPDVKKIFPLSVRSSAIFTDTTIEHSALVDKLSGQLDEIIVLYFGLKPALVEESN